MMNREPAADLPVPPWRIGRKGKISQVIRAIVLLPRQPMHQPWPEKAIQQTSHKGRKTRLDLTESGWLKPF
jgi:hypothetical protein